MTKYIRIKNGECSFTIIEEFDSIEKAANSSNEGTNVEVKIENVKESILPSNKPRRKII